MFCNYQLIIFFFQKDINLDNCEIFLNARNGLHIFNNSIEATDSKIIIQALHLMVILIYFETKHPKFPIFSHFSPPHTLIKLTTRGE